MNNKMFFDIGIKGIGSYVPENILTNEDIDSLNVGTNSKWTKEKLGIEERHIVDGEVPSDLAYKSSLNAIKDAGINKEDIDLIILATSSADRISPSTASIMSDKLGIKCPAFDINAVCTGFVYGLQLASTLIHSGQYENILLVASEAYSKITDWSSRNCIFFGDGSGTVVISKMENALIATNIYGDGIGKDIFTCHHRGTFKMNGRAVYDFGVTTLPKTIKEVLCMYNLTTEDITWVIPHQPSHNILFETARILNMPIEKFVFNMTKFGNTAGASIPMALDKLYKDNKIKNNDIILMPAIGSGWTWGVSVIKYYR